ncbi:MAG TPA: RDD family protein, partial [Candidatus Limnocylindria bacterium]|nr:RDD family protein [Candidatus Limnocylindria bacterium]
MTPTPPEQPAAPRPSAPEQPPAPAAPPAFPPPAPAAAAAPVAAAPTYGGFWIRFLAIFLDGIILAVVSSALAPILGIGQVVTTSTDAGVVQINYTYNALGTLLGLLYFIGFWSLRGQTPGMIPFRLRVVRASD